MSRFEETFSTTFGDFIPIFQKKVPPCDDSDDYLLISGHFFGLESFLFRGVSTQHAHQILQAKSVYIELFMHLSAYRICDQLGLSPDAILSCSSRGFEILSPTIDYQTLEELRQSFNSFCLNHFYGLGGLSLVWMSCTSAIWQDRVAYREFQEEMRGRIEQAWYQKFDLPNQQALLAYDEDIDHQNLCPICNLRQGKREAICDLCQQWMKLGESLVENKSVALVRNDGEIDFFDGYGIAFDDRSDAIALMDLSQITYCTTNEREEIASLNDLAERSSPTNDHGLKALGLLKGDIDNLEIFLEQNHLKASFEHLHSFMASLDQFFKQDLSHLMYQSYPNTSILFAEAGHFFLIGAWDQIIDLAQQIEEAFRRFTYDRLSLSMGIVIANPSTPMEYLVQSCNAALEASKAFQGKSAITLFGETVAWKTYREAKALYQALDTAQKRLTGLSMHFIEQLFNIVVLRQSMKDPDHLLEGAMWRSRLNYLFQRNIFEYLQESDEEQNIWAQELLNMLNQWIEASPEACKMILSEFIYQRR
ncbi:MAG: hypothetical protein DSY46_02270 [Hydrogenimonas sp.]|nr:MAG: hypothetical protein DSY46_02270 [Hydrogenimonas sp.]